MNSSNQDNELRYTHYLSLAMFLAWFALTAYFASARWLYADSAYTFFRILDAQPLVYDRFTNLLQLWPAQLLVKLNASPVLILNVLNYSLPLLFLASWYFTRKQAGVLSLVFPALLWLTGPQMFFLGYSEISMSMLFFGLLICSKPVSTVKNAMVFTAFVFLMLFAHPAAVLLIIPVLFYQFSAAGKTSFYHAVAIVSVILAVKWMFSPATNPYDKGLMENVLSKEVWKSLADSYSLKYFNGSLSGWLWPIRIGIILVILQFIWLARNTRKAGYGMLLYLAYIGFCVLVLIAIYQAGDAAVMMEKYFYPLQVIVFAGVLLYLREKYIRQLFLIAIFGFGFIGIAGQSYFYQQRVKEMDAMVNRYEQNGRFKVVTNLKSESLGSTWALPYESLCISSLRNRKSVTVRASANGKLQHDSAAAADSLYLGAEFMPPWPQRTLNKKYFSLPAVNYSIDSIPGL